jgi:hypothetical protein
VTTRRTRLIANLANIDQLIEEARELIAAIKADPSDVENELSAPGRCWTN